MKMVVHFVMMKLTWQLCQEAKSGQSVICILSDDTDVLFYLFIG